MVQRHQLKGKSNLKMRTYVERRENSKKEKWRHGMSPSLTIRKPSPVRLWSLYLDERWKLW
jgi:hypothetical protein